MSPACTEANDGSATPVTVYCGPWVLKTVDINGTSLAVVPLALIPIGFRTYKVSKIQNWPAAANTTLIAKIKTYLRVADPAATFSDDF